MHRHFPGPLFARHNSPVPAAGCSWRIQNSSVNGSAPEAESQAGWNLHGVELFDATAVAWIGDLDG